MPVKEAVEDACHREDLTQFLAETRNITTLPQVTSRIISTLEDPESLPRALQDIIHSDPPLTARILKVVNSAFYGMPRPVNTIERAIRLLGMAGVKTVATAASLRAMFGGAAICDGFVTRDLWVHSIAVAIAARDLALATKLAFADDAFLAGLIHDIGLLGALQTRPRMVRAVCDAARVEGGEFCALERRMIGFDHPELGMGLAAHWRLPVHCQLVAGHHHRPEVGGGTDASRSLLRVVHAADTICCQAGYGFNLTALRQPLDTISLAQMHLDAPAVAETRQRLDVLVGEAVALLG